MATRTIQFLGQGYSPEPTTITATWGGTVVYTGPIPTTNSGFPGEGYVPTDIMFTYDVDVTLAGNISMSIDVTSGNLLTGTILANYANVYTASGNVHYVSSGPTVYRYINNYHNAVDPSLQDVRSNVLIDGVAPVISRDPSTEGTYSYEVSSGSTIVCDVGVVAGLL